MMYHVSNDGTGSRRYFSLVMNRTGHVRIDQYLQCAVYKAGIERLALRAKLLKPVAKLDQRITGLNELRLQLPHIKPLQDTTQEAHSAATHQTTAGYHTTDPCTMPHIKPLQDTTQQTHAQCHTSIHFRIPHI